MPRVQKKGEKEENKREKVRGKKGKKAFMASSALLGFVCNRVTYIKLWV
jgi:hypothetical protein